MLAQRLRHEVLVALSPYLPSKNDDAQSTLPTRTELSRPERPLDL